MTDKETIKIVARAIYEIHQSNGSYCYRLAKAAIEAYKKSPRKSEVKSCKHHWKDLPGAEICKNCKTVIW